MAAKKDFFSNMITYLIIYDLMTVGIFENHYPSLLSRLSPTMLLYFCKFDCDIVQAFILKPTNVTSNSITPRIKGTSDIPTMVACIND